MGSVPVLRVASLSKGFTRVIPEEDVTSTSFSSAKSWLMGRIHSGFLSAGLSRYTATEKYSLGNNNKGLL